MSLLLLLPLLLAAPLLQEKGAWEEFKSVEGNFSILLPAKPQEQKQEITEAGLKLSVVMYIATDAEMVYLASYTQYPEAQRDPEKIAANALGGFLQSIKAEAVTKKEMTFAGVKGLQCTYEAAETGLVGEVRIHFIGNRLYQVLGMAVKKGWKKEDAAKALDSFKLLDEQKK